MASGKINIVTEVPPNKRTKGQTYAPTWWEIDGDVMGDLGIHRPFVIEDDTLVMLSRGWQVTCIPSGMMQRKFPTKKQCIAYCEAFNRIAADNGAGGEMVYSRGLGRAYWKPNAAYMQAHNAALAEIESTTKVTE